MKRNNNSGPLIKSGLRFFLLIPIFLILSGCVFERELASKFILKEPLPRIILNAPQNIFVFSSVPIEQDTANLKPWQIDSLRYFNSKIIKNILPEDVDYAYMKGFVSQLKKYGFDISLSVGREELIDQSSERRDNSIEISIPQIEIEETIERVGDAIVYDRKEYYKFFDLTALILSAWIQIDKEKDSSQYYFIQDTLSDKVNGFFYQLVSGEVKYHYDYDTLFHEEANKFIYDAGVYHATCFFDQLLNDYVKKHLKSPHSHIDLYHYDPALQRIFLIDKLSWDRLR